jgi:hypothetical protein
MTDHLVLVAHRDNRDGPHMICAADASWRLPPRGLADAIHPPCAWDVRLRWHLHWLAHHRPPGGLHPPIRPTIPSPRICGAAATVHRSNRVPSPSRRPGGLPCVGSTSFTVAPAMRQRCRRCRPRVGKTSCTVTPAMRQRRRRCRPRVGNTSFTVTPAMRRRRGAAGRQRAQSHPARQRDDCDAMRHERDVAVPSITAGRPSHPSSSAHAFSELQQDSFGACQ